MPCVGAQHHLPRAHCSLTLPLCRPAKQNKENAPGEQQAALPPGGSLVAALAALRKSGDGRAQPAAAPAPHNQLPAPQAEQPQAEAGDGGKGGKRRKRLLPSAPLSTDMQAALGEMDGESALLRHKVAQRQQAAAAPAAAGGAAKRSRRQTQFYRL